MSKKKDEKTAALEAEKLALEVEEKRLEIEEKKRSAKDAKRRAKHARSVDEIALQARAIDLLAKERDHLPVLERAGGVFRLEEGVASNVLTLISRIQTYAADRPGAAITLRLFSPGGSVIHGFALYDLLRSLSEAGHEVTTEVRGYCGSMASVIFLAGDVRRIGAQSFTHQHELSTITWGKMSELADEMDFAKKLEEKVASIYADRTKLTKKRFFDKIRKTEWWADADEALSLGIATETC